MNNLEEIKKRAFSWALTPYDSCEECIDLGYSNTLRNCGQEVLTLLGERIPEPCEDASFCMNEEPHEKHDCLFPVFE